MDLEIAVRSFDKVTILDLRGKILIGETSKLLTSTLQKTIEGGARHLLLNLADASQIDSIGLGAIMRTFVTVEQSGGSLKLLRPRGYVRAVFEMMNLIGPVPTFEDEGEALSSFR